jgi:two-component system cell cycle sensor histidine kinase/response regulator CckA
MLHLGLSRRVVILGMACAVTAVWLMLRQSLFADQPLLWLGIAGALGVLLAGLILWQALRAGLGWVQIRILDTTLHDDPAACLLVRSRDGVILWRNMAARDQFAADAQMTQLLADYCAQPTVYMRRLHDAASARGIVRTDLIVAGAPQVITVKACLNGDLLWRVRATPKANAEAVPDVLNWVHVGPDGNVIAASGQMLARQTRARMMVDDLFLGGAPSSRELSPVILSPDGVPALSVRLDDLQGGTVLLILPPDMAPTLRADAQAALNLLPVAIAHIDPDDLISFANAEARRLLSVSEHEQACFSDRLEGLGRPIAEWLDDIRSNRQGRGTEVLRLARTGGASYVQVSVRPLPNGPVGTLLAVMNDATELKSLEAKFTQSQKMHAIGQLAGGVAHDFNNLLTAISGHCELILLRHDRSDVDYPDLMQIQQNSNRAAALVRQLLAFSRKQTLQFETLDLQAALGDLVHLMNRLVGEKITLSLRFADRPIAIRSDRRQFEQILVNLVVNSRDAMPLGGEIVIETSLRNLPLGLQRERATLPPGEYAVIAVRDQGIGIPAANLAKLFEPFFTTKRQGEGTGLGLSTVYGIVKQMGGFIFIDSEEGAGTTVSLYFKPKSIRDVTPRPDPRAPELGGISQKRSLVLLVEDEAPVRSFAARALQLQGHRVLEAESGEAALALLADGVVRPDLFVTDVIMPGLDGPSWIAQVRDSYPLTPVVFMSGYAEDGRSAAQARTEHSVFLAKPFSLGEFTATVNAQLKAVREQA